MSNRRSSRFSFHGSPVRDDEVRNLPDHLIIADHDNADSQFGTLIVRRRTERFVPVPASIPRQRGAA